jgi:SAM-dependent methyltransferase
MSYLSTTKDFYKEAALKPDIGLCCTTSPIWKFPMLEIPKIMQEMNYGCGTTIHFRDLANSPTVVYVGVGGGMELLQFAYFSRKAGAIIGVDAVDEMLEVCQKNLKIAENQNNWFDSSFVSLRKGDALNLPIEDESADVAAQNCLFNIFKMDDLKKALQEMYRILKPHGKLVMSDPICEQEMNKTLRNDERLRAMCLSGSISLNSYINALVEVGFGTIEIRAKRPYRILDPHNFPTNELIFIESIEVCAIKDPLPEDGACVFTGKSAIYYGKEDYFDDHKGHILFKNQPLSVCDKTAQALASLNRNDIYISTSTFHYDGGGCC